MAFVNHVLVATDFSVASAHALRMAADLASRLGVRLSVMHVVPPYPHPYPVQFSDEARATARQKLDDAVGSVGGEASPLLCEGLPADEIVATAARVSADLVIVGSRGRRGPLRAVLGGVAEKVGRLSPVPVLTVHPWRFEDRADAGRELAVALQPLRSAAPGVIAISRSAVMVAAEVGGSFEETPDLLLAMPVRHDGILLGAICEEGTVRLDPSAAASSVSAFDRDAAFEAARALLRDESTALRGSGWIGDVFERAVVVVTDALDEPWSVLVVCDVLRRLQASRVIVAAPAGSSVASAVVDGEVDELIVAHTLDGVDPSSIYRDDGPCTVREAHQALGL